MNNMIQKEQHFLQHVVQKEATALPLIHINNITDQYIRKIHKPNSKIPEYMFVIHFSQPT